MNPGEGKPIRRVTTAWLRDPKRENWNVPNLSGDWQKIRRMRSCRRCGYSDDDCRQCIAATGKPCHWVEADLCSACTSATPAPVQSHRSMGRRATENLETLRRIQPATAKQLAVAALSTDAGIRTWLWLWSDRVTHDGGFPRRYSIRA